MSFFDVFLNVLAVLGIIALGAFIIVFLSDLLISVIDNSNGIFFKRKKTSNDENYSRPKMLKNAPEEEYEQITYQEPKPEERNFVEQKPEPKPEPKQEPIITEAPKETFDGIDYEKAREEEQLLKKQKGPTKEQVEAAEREKNAERLRIIEQRRKEYEEAQKAKEQSKPEPVVEEEPELNEEDINSIIAEVSKESLKEIEEEARINAEKEAEEAKRIANEEKAKLSEEIEELKRQLAEANTQLKDTNAQLQETHTRLADANDQVVSLTKQIEETPVVETVVAAAGMTREEIEEKLVVLRQRLKENEKELSINKKDYMPLRRVNATLESDKKKLRRKEAIVAKQKVLLYGVNNYVDIDEEKAKKLAEELDLLEGLRLSVQHCEEVMAANKDRFPILEKTNKILKKNVDDIKSDIADLEAQLKEMDEADANDDADTTADTNTDIEVDIAPDGTVFVDETTDEDIIDIDSIINSLND